MKKETSKPHQIDKNHGHNNKYRLTEDEMRKTLEALRRTGRVSQKASRASVNPEEENRIIEEYSPGGSLPRIYTQYHAGAPDIETEHACSYKTPAPEDEEKVRRDNEDHPMCSTDESSGHRLFGASRVFPRIQPEQDVDMSHLTQLENRPGVPMESEHEYHDHRSPCNVSFFRSIRPRNYDRDPMGALAEATRWSSMLGDEMVFRIGAADGGVGIVVGEVLFGPIESLRSVRAWIEYYRAVSACGGVPEGFWGYMGREEAGEDDGVVVVVVAAAAAADDYDDDDDEAT